MGQSLGLCQDTINAETADVLRGRFEHAISLFERSPDYVATEVGTYTSQLHQTKKKVLDKF